MAVKFLNDIFFFEIKGMIVLGKIIIKKVTTKNKAVAIPLIDEKIITDKRTLYFNLKNNL